MSAQYRLAKRKSDLVLVFVAALSLLLLLPAQPAQAQTFTVLHSFTGENDGENPGSGLLLDASGNLYGETAWGGHFGADCSVGCGTVKG